MDWKKYAYTFLITAAIFGTAIFLSNFFNQKKLNEIKDIESRIAVDILASETQFSLLEELSCRDIGNTFLSKELAELGDRLSYTEESRGTDDPEVMNLKRYYSLLEIKDFLLYQKVKDRCGAPEGFLPPIIYFYSNEEGVCDGCEREGYVLTRLREEYPDLRVYSFDYDLNLSAISTLVNIYGVKGELPALLINEKTYYGFKSIEDIKEIIPALKEIDRQKAEAEKQATSTKDN
ncbi:MAG TPA: hypothetical protein VJB58_00690 [Candidatus Paceibacterota bacterium]